MKAVKYLFIGILTLALGTAFAGSTGKVSKLFVVTGKSAQVTKAHGHTFISFKDPAVNYFTDRPVRKAGAESVHKFVSNWTKGSNSFAKDNPNAAFVASEHHQGEKQFLRLSHPAYDSIAQTLTFSVAGIAKKADLPVGLYHHPVLFVDNTRSCGAGRVDNNPSCL